jgi:hypothetical protein
VDNLTSDLNHFGWVPALVGRNSLFKPVSMGPKPGLIFISILLFTI